MNGDGRITQKANISLDSLTCTFRQNTDGPYMNLVSEYYPSKKMTFNTLILLNHNPVLKRRYSNYFKPRRERCDRFVFDNEIDSYLFLSNKTTTLFKNYRQHDSNWIHIYIFFFLVENFSTLVVYVYVWVSVCTTKEKQKIESVSYKSYFFHILVLYIHYFSSFLLVFYIVTKYCYLFIFKTTFFFFFFLFFLFIVVYCFC